MSREKDWAVDVAGRAAGTGDQTEAIGKGLAAVALALLDVAHAIRELTQAQTPHEPGRPPAQAPPA